MGDHLTQIGIGGIFALLVIREVFTHVQKSRDKKNGTLPLVRVGEIPQECHDGIQELRRMCKELKATATETSELVEKTFDMHNVRNGAGQPVWYTGSLIEAVKQQCIAIEVLTANIKEQTVAIRELNALVQKLNGAK